MISINRASKSDRTMGATTGLSVSEFDELTPKFAQELEAERWNKYERGVEEGDRERRPGGGRRWNLRTVSEKFFFILLYFKCYPTFDVLGLVFDLNRSNACRNIRKLTPILENALGKELVLPEREINSLDGLFRIFPEAKDIFIDGTERPIWRPKDHEKQKKNYSGKDEKRLIGYPSPTVEGKKYDYGSG